MSTNQFSAPDPYFAPQLTDAALWILTRADTFVAATLRQQGAWGWELQVRHGAFCAARRFDRREDAVAYAEAVRQDKLSQGWL